MKTFREWLLEDHKITDKAVSDVISRYDRFQRLRKGSKFLDAHEARYKLEREKEFHNLTVNVQSQMRRAVRLHFKYKDYVEDKTRS